MTENNAFEFDMKVLGFSEFQIVSVGAVFEFKSDGTLKSSALNIFVALLSLPVTPSVHRVHMYSPLITVFCLHTSKIQRWIPWSI